VQSPHAISTAFVASNPHTSNALDCLALGCWIGSLPPRGIDAESHHNVACTVRSETLDRSPAIKSKEIWLSFGGASPTKGHERERMYLKTKKNSPLVRWARLLGARVQEFPEESGRLLMLQDAYPQNCRWVGRLQGHPPRRTVPLQPLIRCHASALIELVAEFKQICGKFGPTVAASGRQATRPDNLCR
jgi:hypothetical protein